MQTWPTQIGSLKRPHVGCRACNSFHENLGCRVIKKSLQLAKDWKFEKTPRLKRERSNNT